MQKEPSRRNHRRMEIQVSAGERGVVCFHVEKVKTYVFAQHVIRPMGAADLGVFFQKNFASMRLLLVSGSDSENHRQKQIQTSDANSQPTNVVLDSGLLDF